MNVIAAVRPTETWSGADVAFGIAILLVLAVILVWGVRRFLRGG